MLLSNKVKLGENEETEYIISYQFMGTRIPWKAIECIFENVMSTVQQKSSKFNFNLFVFMAIKMHPLAGHLGCKYILRSSVGSVVLK